MPCVSVHIYIKNNFVNGKSEKHLEIMTFLFTVIYIYSTCINVLSRVTSKGRAILLHKISYDRFKMIKIYDFICFLFLKKLTSLILVYYFCHPCFDLIFHPYFLLEKQT